MSVTFGELSVSKLAKQLETSSGAEFQTILKSLRSPSYVNDQLLKSELGLLVTKTLKLLRSSDDFDVWKGCHTSAVICAYNPLVLCAHSAQLLAAVYAKLEQKSNYYASTMNTSQGRVVLETLVSTTSILIDLMRNKPTLSREGLVPKLKSIIPTLINVSQYQPKICLPVLRTLLYQNSTTFKPFANKYRIVLSQLIAKDYEHLDKETKYLICVNYAYLHLIKLQGNQAQDDDASLAHHKSFLDDNWRIGLFSILYQFKPIIMLCGDILDLDQDKDLVNLIKNLPEAVDKKDLAAKLLDLPALKLDMNVPLTLWDISNRLNLLVDLLSAFISLPTPFTVRVPLGAVNSISESLLFMSSNYLPLKRDLRRDLELNSVIMNILPQIQFSGIRLLDSMVSVYGNSCLTFLPTILGSLEMFIPMKSKSTIVDFEKCQLLKSEFFSLFALINKLSSYIGHQLNEINLFTKLIDISLYLVEDKSLISNLFKNQEKAVIVTNSSGKKSSKKDTKSGALSDIYTHPSQFTTKDSLNLFKEVNTFLRIVLSNWKLPSSQQVKIIQYAITKSLHFKKLTGKIPTTFIMLMRTVVIYPGNERVSILPIAANLVKELGDDILDVLCHPRLPMGIVHQVSKPVFVAESDESGDQEISESSSFSNSITLDLELAGAIIETKNNNLKQLQQEDNKISSSNVDDSQLFKKRSMEKSEEQVEIKRSKQEAHETSSLTIENTAGNVTEQITFESTTIALQTGEPEEDADDSEFEIPDIQLSDDEEDGSDN